MYDKRTNNEYYVFHLGEISGLYPSVNPREHYRSRHCQYFNTDRYVRPLRPCCLFIIYFVLIYNLYSKDLMTTHSHYLTCGDFLCKIIIHSGRNGFLQRTENLLVAKATLSDASIRRHQTALTTEQEPVHFVFDNWPRLTIK